MVVLATLCWGASVATGKYALRDLNGFDLLAIEVGVAALVLWPIAARRRAHRGTTGGWRPFIVLALFEPALTFAFLNLGIDRTSAASAAVLMALEAPAGALIAMLLLGERLRPGVAVGILVSSGGAAIVGLRGGFNLSLAGEALVLLSAVSAGAFTVAARRLAPTTPALTLTQRQFAIGTVFVAPIVLAGWLTVGSGLPRASAGGILAAVVTGLIGSALAFWLYGMGLARISVAAASPFLNLIPVAGVTCAVLFLGEQLPFNVIAGGIMVLAGIALADRANRDRAGSGGFGRPVRGLGVGRIRLRRGPRPLVQPPTATYQDRRT